MTKAEVANLLMDKTGLARNEAHDAVELFLGCIKGALSSGEKVSLVGFGTFLVKTKQGRNGRNPRTGEPIQIGEKHVVVFKPGKSFREACNQGATGEDADH
jgi:nucleoid DNA-binding protein